MALLPETLLLHKREGERLIPRFLEPADDGWLAEMIVRREHAVGRPQLELEAWLLGDGSLAKRRLVAKVLARMARPLREPTRDPVRTREAVFAASSLVRGQPGHRDLAIAFAAAALSTSAAEVDASLFADLPGERKVAALAAPLSPEALRVHVNAALAAGFLLRAVRVTVSTGRDPLPLVRHARWNGLIGERREGALTLSGPFTLFRHTGLYGRALAGILPVLAQLGAFTAEATVILRGTAGRLVLDATSPIFGAGDPVSKPDPAIARLAREIERTEPGWKAVADPAPITGNGGEILDADLLLAPRAGGAEWHVERLSFWTAAHVRERVARWAAVGANAILLLDARYNVAEEPAPEHPSVLVFRQKPDPAALFERIRAAPLHHRVAEQVT